MEDTKKLETLDYRPPGTIDKPVNASPTVMGFNSVVIKPETRVNKTKDAKKPLEQAICDDSNEPNQNILIIEEIECLMSQVNDKLDELDGGHYACVKAVKKTQAFEEIGLFQKTTLFELRKAFE